jgi:sRNA-binding protein
MSNLSLKEQLEALSLQVPTNKQENSKKHKKNPVESKAHKPKPAWLEYAQYGVELLRAHYPECFKENQEIKPLKVGIKQDLIKQLSSRDDIVVSDKGCMVNSLAYYVNLTAYHKSVVEGAHRIGLDGHIVGTVTPEEAKYSLERCQAKLKKQKAAKSKASTPKEVEY